MKRTTTIVAQQKKKIAGFYTGDELYQMQYMRQGFPLALAHSPMRVSKLTGEWNFHLQEMKQALNCHRLIRFTTYSSKLVGLC